MANREREKKQSGLAGQQRDDERQSGLASAGELGGVLPSDWNELSDAAKMSWCFYQSFTSDYPTVCDEILAGNTNPGYTDPGYQQPIQMGMSGAMPWVLGAVAVGMVGMAFMNAND